MFQCLSLYSPYCIDFRAKLPECWLKQRSLSVQYCQQDFLLQTLKAIAGQIQDFRRVKWMLVRAILMRVV
jgi:hypothetical protein